jgi:single-stranded-DNA-specific exonuclease
MARWVRSTVDAALVESLSREVKIPEFLARLLVLRGIRDAAEAGRFLHPSLAHLHDPYLMRGMREAVERLRRACSRAEKILIYGDYDVDGTTAVVLLLKVIELAGGQARFYIPHRLKDGYGMREEVIEHAARDGVQLIVSVDTGIRESAVVERANQLGIDVIVTDHHLPDSVSPPAVAVLNPNQPGCGYPEKNLCGVGVVFKLAQALLGSLNWPPARFERIIQSILRIVAIGTVADVVPLLGENRTIVKFGLDALRRPVNPGLKALLAAAGFTNGRAPTAAGVAFWLAPRINAAGRMDTANEVIELFTVADAQRAAELAEKLGSLNSDRQQAEAHIVRQILESLEPGVSGAPCLVAAGEGWHRGVLGIVAARLVERFHRPSVVISVDPEERVAYGSGRSIRTFHLLAALESMREVFVRFGGHRQAAGFSLPAGRLDEFRRRFHEYAAARLTPEDCVPEIHVDADLNLAEITDENMQRLLQLEPYGLGNAEPVFAAAGLKLSSEPRILKEKHLRLTLRQEGRSIAAIGWNMGSRAAELAAGATIDAAFNIEPDDYMGGWRLVLRDVIPPR